MKKDKGNNMMLLAYSDPGTGPNVYMCAHYTRVCVWCCDTSACIPCMDGYLQKYACVFGQGSSWLQMYTHVHIHV